MKSDRFLTCAAAFGVGLAMVIYAAGCSTLPPNVSLTDCEVMCTKQGRTLRTYRVGSAVPIFKRTPPVVCECS